jgi:hypothetical protein
VNRQNINLNNEESAGVNVPRGLAQIWRSKAGTGVWMSGAFAVALVLAIAVITVAGTNEKGIGIALRLTGRLSFLFFWPAYTGRAIAVRFGPRFGALARLGREFGLSYAAAQLVHFTLVIWVIRISHRPAIDGVMPFFAIGVVWTYVLALFSVDRFCNAFDSNLCRIFRTIGLEYIALVFFVDFILVPARQDLMKTVAYLPFAILLIVGFVLRMAAIIPRAGRGARGSTFRSSRGSAISTRCGRSAPVTLFINWDGGDRMVASGEWSARRRERNNGRAGEPAGGGCGSHLQPGE